VSYVGLEDFEQAFQWLEKARENREYLAGLKVAPVYDPLHSALTSFSARSDST
jgi:hypothetical protein